MRSEEIYDTLFDDQAFAELPGKLAQIVGGRSAVVGWIYADGIQRFLGANDYFGDHYIAEYLSDYAAEDPWTLATVSNFRPNQLVDALDLVPDERYAKSRLYNEFFRAIGDDTFRALSISSQNDDGMGSLAIHRGKSSRGFSDKGKQALARIAPHVGRVVSLRAKLEKLTESRDMARLVADQGPLATLVIDARRRLVHANSGGEALLRQSTYLTAKWGRVAAVGKMAKAIDDALARALVAAPSPSLVTVPRAERVPLTIDVVPMPIGATMRGALLIVRDPEAMGPNTAQRLTAVFGLTPTQAEVALGLAEGRTIEELAISRGSSRETLRVHVRDVAARLGCSRQAEIAAVVRAIGVLSKTHL